MKSMNGSATKRTFGVCMLMATLLFGPAVAKADAVLDWNLIAVNTSDREWPEPVRPGPKRSDCPTRCL